METNDKALHLLCSFLLTAALKTRPLELSNTEAASIALSVGLLKEYAIDSKPDQVDVGANVVGVLLALPL
jgi:hypothetical protein